MKLTPQELMFLLMIIDTAAKWALRTIENLTEAELDELINNEEKRSAGLMAELKGGSRGR